MMEKNFCFLLKRNEYETVGFRFFPERSHVHGFGDECPKTWDEVYKVYYDWSIYITEFGRRSTFDIWDEGSALDDVAEIITQLAAVDKADSVSLKAFGDGADWDIRYYVDKEFNFRCFQFGVWNHNRGFRFFLDRDDAVRFAAFIRKVLAYMLKHSEPI